VYTIKQKDMSTTTLELKKHLESLGERDFHPTETFKVLVHDIFNWLSWNVQGDPMIVGKCDDGYVKGMILRVKTPRYTGMFMITLSYADYYNIRLLSNDFSVTHFDNSEIFFTDLVDEINKLIL
jgi:hypothetical protein